MPSCDPTSAVSDTRVARGRTRVCPPAIPPRRSVIPAWRGDVPAYALLRSHLGGQSYPRGSGTYPRMPSCDPTSAVSHTRVARGRTRVCPPAIPPRRSVMPAWLGDVPAYALLRSHLGGQSYPRGSGTYPRMPSCDPTSAVSHVRV